MATMRQTVRRDNCELTKSLIDTCLRKILIDRDTRAAEEYVGGRSTTWSAECTSLTQH